MRALFIIHLPHDYSSYRTYGCAVTAGQANIMIHLGQTVVVSEYRLVGASVYACSAAFTVAGIDMYLLAADIRHIILRESPFRISGQPVYFLFFPMPTMMESMPVSEDT